MSWDRGFCLRNERVHFIQFQPTVESPTSDLLVPARVLKEHASNAETLFEVVVARGRVAEARLQHRIILQRRQVEIALLHVRRLAQTAFKIEMC